MKLLGERQHHHGPQVRSSEHCTPGETNPIEECAVFEENWNVKTYSTLEEFNGTAGGCLQKVFIINHVFLATKGGTSGAAGTVVAGEQTLGWQNGRVL